MTSMLQRSVILFLFLFSNFLPISVFAQSSHASHADGHSSTAMPGMYGPYPMPRDSSGTSWQPDSTPMDGQHWMVKDWMLMAHGYAMGVYDFQQGPRGGQDVFGSNMLMFMAQRPIGGGATLGLRGMFSLEPATIGPEGYPLLFQTGETSDGIHHLIDRQHPHDFFMELATVVSVDYSDVGSVFFYFGLPGEPALGPPAFMHRLSGMEFPEAPITHHWLDATHISEGVATLGFIWRGLKLEASLFNGREPDQHRWDIEAPKLQSYSFRLSYNPTADWALQASYGHLHSPEALEPEVDTDRISFSAIYNKVWGRNFWQAMFAWGMNRNHPGNNLNAFLLESTLNMGGHHNILNRFESVAKDELFEEPDAREGAPFTVNKVTLGYLYDLPTWHHMKWGFGAMGSVHLIPQALQEDYGEVPLSAFLWTRVKWE